MVDGDLKAAIELYKKIAQSGNRAAAAKALVRMGQCYEKLGDAEARKAYERVVREFGDQTEAVAEARKRLAEKEGAAETGVVTRLVTTFDDGTYYRIALAGQPGSAGERYMVLVREGATFVRDLETGQERRALEPPPQGEYFDALSFPDGKRLLLTRYFEKRSDLYIVGPDGSNRRRVGSEVSLEATHDDVRFAVERRLVGLPDQIPRCKEFRVWGSRYFARTNSSTQLSPGFSRILTLPVSSGTSPCKHSYWRLLTPWHSF